MTDHTTRLNLEEPEAAAAGRLPPMVFEYLADGARRVLELRSDEDDLALGLADFRTPGELTRDFVD
jgi:hypothetical protein